MARTRAHAIIGVAVVALCSATGYAFTRVFDGTRWMIALIFAATCSVVISIVGTSRQWKWPAMLGAHLAAVIWLGAVVARPRELFVILPTPSSVAHWFRDIAQALDVLRNTVVPSPAEGAQLQLVLACIYGAAAISTRFAVRDDGIMHAFAAPLGVFTIAATLGKGAYGWSASLWVGAALALLLTHAVVTSGVGRTQFRAGTRVRSKMVSGGVLSVIAAVLFGSLLGPQLPSATSRPLLQYRNFGDGDGDARITAISPLVQIRDRLNNQRDRELFTVKADREMRWRLGALDSYVDAQWTINDNLAERKLAAVREDDLTRRTTVIQDFKIGPMGGSWLPAGFEADAYTGNVTGLRFLNATSGFVVPDRSHEGVEYTVVSLLPAATPTELRASDDNETDRNIFDANTRLDTRVSDKVRDLASDLTSDAPTRFDKALALQNYLRSKDFKYDTGVDYSDDTDPLEAFLFEGRKGFCEQFADSFTVMARSLGIPTRIAVGFNSSPAVDGVFRVTTKQAHAWPEVYFPGQGWIAFEPTPSIFDGASPNDPNGTGRQRPNAAGPPGNVSTTTVPSATTTTSGQARPTSPTQDRRTTTPVSTAATGNPGSGSATLRFVGVAAAVIATPLLALGVYKTQRRRRRRTRGEARDQVLGAWMHTTEVLARVGIRRRPSTTSMEFALREGPARGVGAAGPALLELARLHTDALYGADTVDDDDATEAWNLVRAVERAVVAATPTRRRRLMLRLKV